MPKYTRIPTLSQWQSDSSVPLALRQSDPVLARIDALVSTFHGGSVGAMCPVACDLYFAIDYWLQHVKTNRGMEKRREPAMHALYVSVVDFLCGAFNCQVNTLPRELDLMFGRELSKIGFDTDFVHGKAKYLERSQIEAYRIWFKNGLAYQWSVPPEKAGRKLAQSARTHNAAAVIQVNGQRPAVDYGPFVLTMGRSIYMARHEQGEAKSFGGFYHSTYLAGQAVMAAGSMLIESGRIKRIRSDSGHYKPFDSNLLQVLQTLEMLRVPIQQIVVEDYLGKTAVSAIDFRKENADWNKLKKSRDKNLAERRDLYGYKEERRNPRPASESVDLGEGAYEDRGA